MKLLHVSDWHLGRTTYNVSRAPDHDAVLAEILRYAQEHRPDLILHTGDLFDAVRPAYADMARGITALQDLAVVAPVVVLCGNHDSPALFDLLAQLVGSTSRVHFVSKARPPGQGGVLSFDSADGFVVRLASVPFIHANRMLDGFEDASTWTALYADRVHLVEEALARGLLSEFDNRRDIAVFAAHLHVGGAVLSGSERPVHVGSAYASHLEHVPPVTYAAFGHIHKPQPLPGTVVNGAYAGSPVQLDFGELDEAKRAVLVEARPGYPPEVVSLPLSGGRPLWRFDGTFDGLSAVAPDVGAVLALVTVQVPSATVDLRAQVQDLLPEAVLLQVYEVAADRRLTVATEPSSEGPEPSIEELFRGYLSEQGTRGAAADHVLATFSKLLEAVEAEQPVSFAEEAVVTATLPTQPGPTGQLVSPAAAQHEGAPPAAVVPTAGARLIECRRCGARFEVPAKRGRPPALCPACRGGQPLRTMFQEGQV